MAKFHVSSDGNPRVCSSSEGKCPFGGNENHYTSKEAARAAFEESMKVPASTAKKNHFGEPVQSVDDRGNVEWRNSNGELHRDGDLPAFERPDGTKYWFRNGKLHRDGDQPAVELSNGTKMWYQNGKGHRDNDKPAIEWANGAKDWYQNDKLHRDGDLPAHLVVDGVKGWYQNNRLHRDGDQPARVFSDGTLEWWINGEFQYSILPDGTRIEKETK